MQKRSQETSDFLERQQDEIDRIMTSIDDQEVILGCFSSPHLVRSSILWCNEWFYKVNYEDQICLPWRN